MTNQTDKINDKRKAIMETTLRLFSERGLHDTPMSLVAKESGVAVGTIYRYFADKETLINELFIEYKGRMMHSAMAGIMPEDDFESLYKKQWRNLYNWCVTHPDAMIFIEQYYNTPFRTPEIQAAVDKFYAPWISKVEEAQEADILRKMPFEMFVLYTYDVVIAYAKRQIRGALVMDEAMLKQAMDLSWEISKGGA